MSSCVTKSAWSIWTAVKNSVRSEKKNNGAEIVLRQAYENSSTRALQQAMVVTVREESPTNNATRDYLTDLTYQCPKGTYKEWLENSLELISVKFWNQTDCLVHNNREYLFNNAFFIFVVNIVKLEIRKKAWLLLRRQWPRIRDYWTAASREHQVSTASCMYDDNKRWRRASWIYQHYRKGLLFISSIIVNIILTWN